MNSPWKRWVSAEELKLLVTERFNCPSCGGHRTLSVTKTPQGVKYRCFRASCDVKGIDKVTFNQEELKEIVTGRADRPVPFQIPEYWVPASHNESTIRYLKDNNSWQVYRDGRADIRYDPKQDRHVFVVRYAGSVYGAAGRGAVSGTRPKWFVYGRPVLPFMAQSRGLPGNDQRASKAFLVEDCASACAVSHVGDGIALLGTNIPDSYMEVLSKYKELVVALDKDASGKALDYQRRLAFYTKTKIKLLDVDLKYMNREQISEMMK